jgi:hypothetical protein
MLPSAAPSSRVLRPNGNTIPRNRAWRLAPRTARLLALGCAVQTVQPGVCGFTTLDLHVRFVAVEQVEYKPIISVNRGRCLPSLADIFVCCARKNCPWPCAEANACAWTPQCTPRTLRSPIVEGLGSVIPQAVKQQGMPQAVNTVDVRTYPASQSGGDFH